MYVIQGSPAVAIGTIGQSETGTFPADRCVWRTVAGADGGYEIIEAEFVPPGGTSYTAISSPILGVIGKTGRFVAITNLYVAP